MKNYVLIGDIHSQYHQLNSALNFISKNIKDYYIIFLGDLFDSRTDCSNSVEVYKTVKELQADKKCSVLQSNHQDKLIRYLKGHNVYLNNGLEKTIQDFSQSNVQNEELFEWISSLAYGLVFKDNSGLEYRCSHAYFSSKIFVPDEYQNEYLIHQVSKTTKSKFLYGIVKDNERIPWWNQESSNNWIRVAGHYHKVHIDLEKNKSIVLDGSCGNDDGKLVIYSVNTKETHSF